MKQVLKKNRDGWNAVADEWFGSTALPNYAPNMATEETLKLFGDLQGKKVLDICCGSGHSMKYMVEKKAGEVWGLDLSDQQLKNAKHHFKELGYEGHFYQSPMEENPGIPENYFDVVYSIYGLGWTTDLNKTIVQMSKYLKKDGIYIFSWDHPMLSCMDVVDGDIHLVKPYYDKDRLTFPEPHDYMKFGKFMISDYINALSQAGMCVEQMIERPAEALFEKEHDLVKHYAKGKSVMYPLSFIIKSRKL